MNFRLRIFLLISLLALTAGAEEPKVVAYIPNWIDLPSFAKSIAYDKVTHLNIAFENPVDDAGTLSFNQGNGSIIKEAKEHHLKVLLSIGGGSASGDQAVLARYGKLLAADRREAFAQKLMDVVVTRGFDGLDVDLEGPSITADYGAFIQALSTLAKASYKLLTAALSRGYGGDKVTAETLRKFDFVNLMAYDATGPWSPQEPGQHSSLEFAKENVRYWLGRGLPKEQAVLGLPFYGYGFGEASKNRDYPYAKILTDFPGAQKSDQVGQTIWYNGIPTIQAKTRFMLETGLAGVMIWSLDSDAKGEHSLLQAIHETLQTWRAR